MTMTANHECVTTETNTETTAGVLATPTVRGIGRKLERMC